MRRREVILGLGATALAPLAAQAQALKVVKRIAWISTTADEAGPTFRRELARLGWVDGRNVRIDALADNDGRVVRAAAPFIVGTAPDLIAIAGTQYTEIFKQLTDAVPILFLNVADPVASGFVASFAHPGGNVTGFSNLEFSIGGKWLGILKDLVPGIANVLVLYDPANVVWRGYLSVIQEAGATLRVTVHPSPAADIADAARQIEAFARDPGGAMIVLPGAVTIGNSETIVALAARHRLPGIYTFKSTVARGGLISYGNDGDDLARRAAQYADRILNGEKPADLPVQAPTKFELVINAKTAKTLGLAIPYKLVAIADAVIE